MKTTTRIWAAVTILCAALALTVNAQITSVSQLKDVKPADEHYTALQSLIERYGVFEPFPDYTFRAEQPLTRGEFTRLLDRGLNRMLDLAEASDLDLSPADLFNQYNANKTGITAISQLKDVPPTNEYYSPIQSLIERFGIDISDADRNYRPAKAVSEKEFYTWIAEIFSASIGGDLSPTRSLTRRDWVIVMNNALNAVNERIAKQAAAAEAEKLGQVAPRVIEVWKNLKASDESRVGKIRAKSWTLAENEAFAAKRKTSLDDIWFNCYELLDALGKSDRRLDQAFLACGELTLENENYNAAVRFLSEASQGTLQEAALTQRSRAYFNLGEFDKALADANAAVKLNPKNGVAYNIIGLCLLEKKDYDNAVASFTQAVNLLPSAKNLRNRGRALTLKKDFANALADFERSVELEPFDAGYIVLQARANLNLGNFQKALADAERGLQVKPTHTASYEARREALVKLGRTAEANADREAAKTAFECYKNKDYNCALQNYNKAIELNRTSTANYTNRGITFDQLGKRNEAVADYNKALEINPKDVLATYNRGVAYEGLGKFSEALVDYREIQRYAPTVETYLLSGRGIFRVADKIITRDSEPGAEIIFAARKSMNKSTLESAVKAFTEAIKLKPDLIEAYERRAAVYRMFGKIEENRSREAEADERKAAELKQANGAGSTAPKNNPPPVAAKSQADAIAGLPSRGRAQIVKYLQSYPPDNACIDFAGASEDLRIAAKNGGIWNGYKIKNNDIGEIVFETNSTCQSGERLILLRIGTAIVTMTDKGVKRLK